MHHFSKDTAVFIYLIEHIRCSKSFTLKLILCFWLIFSRLWKTGCDRSGCEKPLSFYKGDTENYRSVRHNSALGLWSERCLQTRDRCTTCWMLLPQIQQPLKDVKQSQNYLKAAANHSATWGDQKRFESNQQTFDDSGRHFNPLKIS